jgi:ribonuclease P protein component
MSKATAYSLGAGRRLKREQQIETLFRTGKAFSVFPLRFIWILTPRGAEDEPLRAGFSAPKRKFKRAVDRGRVKRLMREAWRLQQGSLWPCIPEEKQLQVFLICTHTRLPDYQTVFDAVSQGMVKLKKSLADA